MFLLLSVSITVELAAFPLLVCARALLVVQTGWPHTGFFMLSFVKSVDCVIVLQLLWEQKCVNFVVAKEVDIIPYPKLCLPVHSPICAFCPATLALCSSVLALICRAVVGSRGFCVWTLLAGLDCCIRDPVQENSALSFAAEAFAVYSIGRL